MSEAARPPADETLNFARRTGDAVSAQGIGGAGLVGFAVAWLIAQRFAISDGSSLLLLFVGCTAAPMALVSIFLNHTHLRSSSGLGAKCRPADWRRCSVKFIGFAGTLLAVALVYRLFPEYTKAFYGPVWDAAALVALPVLVLAIPFIVWVDCRMIEPEDGYWHSGLLLLGRRRAVDFAQIKDHALGWVVKGFFLPLMLAGAAKHLDILMQEGVDFSTFSRLYATMLNLILAADVLFGSIGYLLTLRLLDSHIRTTEPTCVGWTSAVCCYIPFSTFIWSAFLSYKGKTDWMDWLAPYPVVFVSWGFTILVLHVIYAWATVSFGCRFSNLTNRGIMVDGPYRYLKHPAYVSKNLAWWLMAVPFVAHVTWPEALRACVCLALTNAIYAVRAWTEEEHLKNDPAYAVYCRWMAEHSLWAHCKRRMIWRLT